MSTEPDLIRDLNYFRNLALAVVEQAALICEEMAADNLRNHQGRADIELQAAADRIRLLPQTMKGE